ncbi:hypothetical protein BH23ACT11_BH23ACT11_04190 [soil metagenome]
MNFLSNPIVARLLWLAPLLLVVICIALLRAGSEQQSLLQEATPVEAELVWVNLRERSEIVRGEARFRYTSPETNQIVERSYELPLTFLKDLENREGTLVPIRVASAHDQVLIEHFARPQVRLTFINAAMAGMGAMVFGVLVFGWNRHLRREGDPSDAREPDQAGVNSG